jgi:hypothetical protein
MKSSNTTDDICRFSYVAAPAMLKRLRALGPLIRSKDAVAAGIAWRDLYALRDDGSLLEASRGLFHLADVSFANVDFVVVGARAPRGMICLDSALAHWDLTDDIPARVHLAVPEGAHRPAIDYPPTRVHVFRGATFELGRLPVDDHRARYWITDRERTIVDAFRVRHVLGDDTAYGALRRYLGDRPKLRDLSAVARELRVSTHLEAALRVLLA